jgi:hypothetical protein
LLISASGAVPVPQGYRAFHYELITLFETTAWFVWRCGISVHFPSLRSWRSLALCQRALAHVFAVLHSFPAFALGVLVI